jgi:hypothetical protein
MACLATFKVGDPVLMNVSGRLCPEGYPGVVVEVKRCEEHSPNIWVKARFSAGVEYSITGHEFELIPDDSVFALDISQIIDEWRALKKRCYATDNNGEQDDE